MAEKVADLVVQVLVKFKEAVKGMDKVKDSLKDTSKKTSEFGKMFSKLAKFTSVGFIAKKVFENTAAYQTALTSLGSATGETGEALQALGKESMKLSNRFGVATTDIIHGMETLRNLGFESGEALEVLPNILNVVVGTGSDFEDTAAAMEAALNDFKLEAKDSAHVTNVMVKSMRKGNFRMGEWRRALKEAGAGAEAANAKFEDVAASLEILGKAGITGGQAGTALRNIFSSFAKEMSKGAPLFEKWGIDIKNSDGTFKDFSGTIDAIKERFKELNPQQQIAFEMALVGKENYAKLDQIIRRSPESFTALVGGYRNTANEAKSSADSQINTLQGQTDRMKTILDNLLTSNDSAINQMFTSIMTFLNNTLEGAEINLSAIRDVFKISWKYITGDWESGMNELATSTESGFQKLEETVRNAMNNIGNQMQSTAAKAYDWGQSLVNNFSSGAVAATPQLKRMNQNITSFISANLKHTTPKEGPLRDDDKWGLHFVENLTKGIQMGIPNLENTVSGVASTIATADAPSSNTVTNNINVSSRNNTLTERGLASMLDRMRIINGGVF